jgi:hypothetical protein
MSALTQENENLRAALKRIVERCEVFIDDEAGMRTHSVEVLMGIAEDALSQQVGPVPAQNELWAVHAQGPDELYAAFNREDADQHAAALNDLPMPEGIRVSAVVVPSPWAAAEHWKYAAELERDHADELKARATRPAQTEQQQSAPVDERDVLLAEARMVIDACLEDGDLPNELSWMAERASKGRRIYVDDRALPAPIEPAPTQDEREAFEAHYHRLPLERDHLGGAYRDSEVRSLWDAWQARAAIATRPAQTEQQPVKLQHMAYAEDGQLHWISGRKIDNCELYAMPDFGEAPDLYAAPVAQTAPLHVHENLRAALDQAMTAEAYPPARPEYDERGRPFRAMAAQAEKEA